MQFHNIFKSSIVILCLTQITVSSANSFQQIALSAGNESNVPRGLDGMHELDSNWLDINFQFGQLIQLGLNDSLVISGSMRAKRYFDMSGFDDIGVGAATSLQHKFGFGAYAPRLIGSLSYNYENYREEARDNGLLSTELRIEKRLTPAWFVSAGIDYQRSYSKDLPYKALDDALIYDPELQLPYELYDYDSTSTFLSAEYLFPNQVQLSATYRRIDGSTVSSTTQPSLHLYKIADAFYPDPAFSEGWYAYLLESETDEWSFEISMPVGKDASLGIAYSWQDIHAVSSHTYENRLFTINFIQGF